MEIVSLLLCVRVCIIILLGRGVNIVMLENLNGTVLSSHRSL